MHCGGRSSGLLTALLIGSQLTRVNSEPEGHREPLVSRVHCPTCGWQIDKDYAWCPQCGARLRPFQCAYCQGTVPADAESCVHCGAPLD